MDPFIGMIVMFAGNFAPRSWALCDGQLLPIAQNQALFSILGTTYGGDGRSTFGLPELRGRVPMHAGSGPGLQSRPLGQKGGAENTTLSTGNLPSHTHSVAVGVTDEDGNTNEGNGQNLANTVNNNYSSSTSGGALAPTASEATGSAAAFNNLQPYQCVNFIIALQGVYPSRN